ncbi:hypothetical protein WL1483_4096 [Aeromonas schubertii]|uniref:Uncharacterized protein n=1 Tax=Aeromonas schubertii TaxID=652 RepID=A0A0S2SP66_9GAMM|nr:hypothetical protein WL1483_4096 [Aeromonas schubertii]
MVSQNIAGHNLDLIQLPIIKGLTTRVQLIIGCTLLQQIQSIFFRLSAATLSQQVPQAMQQVFPIHQQLQMTLSLMDNANLSLWTALVIRSKQTMAILWSPVA